MKKRDNTDITGIEVKKLPYIAPTNTSNTSRFKVKDLGRPDKDAVLFKTFKKK